MVHGSLTRSKRYSLFFHYRKWEKVSTALPGRERVSTAHWQGKGWLLRYYMLLDVHHLPVICNVRLAGDRNWRCCRFGCRKCGWKCEVGNPGTLVSPGRGNGTGFTDARGRSLPSR